MSGRIPPDKLDVVFTEHDGYPDSFAAEDTRDQLWDAAGAAAREFPKSLWIEPKDWPDAARDNDKYGTWPIDYVNRFTNQSPTHECTTHCLRTVAEAARNRQRAIKVGPPKPKTALEKWQIADSVWFSCLSIYAEANPRKWGGAGTRQVLSIACKRGFLPDKIQPKEYNFKHTLIGTNGKGNLTQSSGDWVPLSRFPEGWEETAKQLKPAEVVFPEEWEQMVCLVLHGYGVGVGRSGHSIPYMKWMTEETAMQYPDSYDLYRYDSLRMVKSAIGGAYSIISFDTPDDWSIPVTYAS